jgi:predicted 2-oxoglutarate/Fe(II)-dependent dioxygenase YbiX
MPAPPTPINDELAAELATVRIPGDFCMAGAVPLLMPQLEVEGVGRIALPLLPAQAQQLVAAAERAPYGRGAETLVDTSVRRTWQIGADRVQLQGKHWGQMLEAMVAQAAQGLGATGTVVAQLYKLLVYDTGSFFVSHRDTEKAPGMFATLVIALPSQHEGGELLVRHKGRERCLDLRCADPAEASFAAFYADCVHEVRPLTAGCRLVLVYNLLRQGRGRPPPDYDAQQTRVAALLQRWGAGRQQAAGNTAPDKLVYLLEHAYTPAELSFAALKGPDAAAAAVLAEAARQAGCDLHAALLTIQESGTAEYTAHYGARRGRWHYRADDDDEDDDHGGSEEFEAGEVDVRSATLSHWARPDGGPPGLAALPFHDEEVCPANALQDLEADDVHFQEATGNEGASFERSYSRAALVLWPAARRLAVLCQAGLHSTLPYLDDVARRWAESGAGQASALWHEAHELSSHMLRAWPEWGSRAAMKGQPSDAAHMLQLLVRLQDTAQIDAALPGICEPGTYDKGDNAAVLAALALLAPPRAGQAVEGIVTRNAAYNPGACADLLSRAVQAGTPAGHLRTAASVLVDALPGGPAHPPDPGYLWQVKAADAACIADLLTALPRIDAALAGHAVQRLLAPPGHFDLDTLLVPALRRLAASADVMAAPAVTRLLAACVAHLRERVAQALEPPGDWTRASRIDCRCAHCNDLAGFLANPVQRSWIFKAAQADRAHVEATIRKHGCDVSCETQRHSRPHSLACTKTQASYERRAAQRRQDLEDLALLAPAG